MKLKRGHIWSLVAMLSFMAATWFTLHQLLRDPGKVVHQLGGDSIKNYFSYIYHSMYGKGWWFDGMNYPYGDNIMYADGQPLLTVTLSSLRNYIQLTPEDLNAILNILLATGFFLAMLYVYKILRKFSVAPLWAIIFAVLIVPLSMQTFRIFGLYGLGYACTIPMTFYWFICYRQSNAYKYIVYLFLLSVAIMFLHPYQFALILFWGGIYIITGLFSKPAIGVSKARHLLPVAGFLVAALIVFKLTAAFTDPIADRPAYPHGLLSYVTTSTNIFTLAHSPYWEYMFEKGWIDEIPVHAVGYAYTGIIPIMVLVCTIFLSVLFFIKKDRIKLHQQLPGNFSPVWLIIGLLALLYSMGIPFVWGLEFLFDYFSILRQFRALNWFALIFYYVGAIYAAVRLYHFYQSNRSREKLSYAVIVLLMPVLLWGYETYGVIKKAHVIGYGFRYNYDFFYTNLHEKSWPDLLKEHNYNADDFQAVLFIPYYHVGSEKIGLTNAAWGLSLAFSACYQLHLPMVDVNMSRASWSQTFSQVKVAGGPFTYKKLFEANKDNRPFLLLHSNGEQLNPNEEYLFNNADSIGETNTLVAYALYPGIILQKERQLKRKVWQVGQSMTDSVTRDFSGLYDHYDDGGNTQALWGKKASLPINDRDSVIRIIETGTWHKDSLYEASVWFLVNDYDYKTPAIDLEQFDTSGNRLSAHTMSAGNATDTEEMWFRASSFFKLHEQCSNLTLTLKAKGLVYHGMDELLIRKVTDTIVTKENNGVLMANNHLIKKGN